MDNYSNLNVKEDIFYDDEGQKYSKTPTFLGFTKYVVGGGGGGFNGNVPSPTGPLPFKGKTTEQKMAMCGVRIGMTPSEAIETGNIIKYQIPGQASYLEYNKNVINDLIAIQNEIHSYCSWFTFKIGNCFRHEISAGGQSLHQIGCAVDINPGGAGNPWFEVHICSWGAGDAQKKKLDLHFNEGDSAPWGFHVDKKGKIVCGGNTIFKKATCIWTFDHPVVTIFRNHGWGWGGAYGDVMHFSLTGG